MSSAHWPEVARIYRQGIDTGHGTFEARPPESWDDFIRHRHGALCRIARASGPGSPVGAFATLAPVSQRAVYAGVAEIGIYVAEDQRGQGLGSALLAEIIRVSEAAGLWTLQAVTFPENEASLALHRKHGFRTVGRRERIGRMSHGPLAGQWRDTILLERRSAAAGI